MSNKKHLEILRDGGVAVWNQWRRENPELIPDLTQVAFAETDISEIDLHNANLSESRFVDAILFKANLCGASLIRANLLGAILCQADLSGANLFEAELNGANLERANLSGANLIAAELNQSHLSQAILRNANLHRAQLARATIFLADLSGSNLSDANLNASFITGTNLKGVDLTNANLYQVSIVDTNLEGANLTGCSIYGISAWNLNLDNSIQSNLVISRMGEPSITVDNLEVAQFLYLLLHNEKIRDVIDMIGKKAVLILGRFTSERKAVLDAIRENLRKRNYIPILFDFDKPASKTLTETVSTLAHMARFIIADITDPKSIPQELQRIVPNLPSVPVQPLLMSSSTEYGMFESFKDYPWVLKIQQYDTLENLISSFEEKVIAPAEAKSNEIEEKRKRQERALAL